MLARHRLPRLVPGLVALLGPYATLGAVRCLAQHPALSGRTPLADQGGLFPYLQV